MVLDGFHLKKKILVVDDEHEIVALIKGRLEASGYSVIVAYDGEEGIKKVNEDRPDLILLDIVMPNKDGLTMFKQLKNDDSTRRIPVLLLTARGETSSIIEAERFGVTEYFIKPCDWEQLLECIQKYLK